MNILEQIQYHSFNLPPAARMEALNFILQLEQHFITATQECAIAPKLIEKNGVLVVKVNPLDDLTDVIMRVREERIDNIIHGACL